MITLYGIPNCDTVRKARRWLEQAGIDYHFHDVRADGLEAAQVTRWLQALGADQLINRRSSSWKALPAAARENLDTARAAELVLEHPTLIKRPLLERDGCVQQVGFAPEQYSDLLLA